MPKQTFVDILKKEVARIDTLGINKRTETVIEGFSRDSSPRAVIRGKNYRIFNSNDYLGLRLHPDLKKAEHEASDRFGTGPGAVRFISGSMSIHRQLEQELAKFHGRDDAMVFSSAFATNLAVLFCLLKGQSRDSLVDDKVLIVSDELNHRSIIDGIRVAGLTSDQKAIFAHLNPTDLHRVLEDNVGKWNRVVIVTDGVFSMLGEYQDLATIQTVIDQFQQKYPQGVWLVVDDAHGIGAFGDTGRGCEEVCNSNADVLIGTLGKAFGADGGYVTGSQEIIDYLRESAATYIYSNSISPGTAGAALQSIKLVSDATGKKLLKKLKGNIDWFKKAMHQAGFTFAVDSIHPIQPWFIGDTAKTKTIKQKLFEQGFLVTNINFPVVPKGRDEIRVQISATHQQSDLTAFVKAAQTITAKL